MTVDSRFAPYGILALRLGLGVLFLIHGLMKVLVMTPAGTAAYFGSLGLPEFLGYLTILAEVGGGLMLILGIFPRAVAIALIPLMLGTIFLVHGKAGFIFSNPGGGWEYPAFWALTLLVLALLGDGKCALLPTPCLCSKTYKHCHNANKSAPTNNS